MRITWSRSAVIVCLTVCTLLLLGLTLSALEAHGRALPAAPATALEEGDVWISIQPTESVVELGETFTVAVAIENAPEIIGYSFRMDWNPAAFSVSKLEDEALSDIPRRLLPLSSIKNEEGALLFEAVVLPSDDPDEPPYPEELPHGDLTLAVITLQATGVGTTTLDLYATRVFTRSRGQVVIPDPGDGTAESICDVAHIEQLEADSPVELGQPTNFTATVTGAAPITYTWDFGDSSPVLVGLGLDATTHTYTDTGTYTATLTVDNLCGVEDTAAVTVTVEEVCESVAILELASDGPVTLGEPVHLTATVTGAQPITYTWDLGDGSPTRVGVGLDAITHTYAALGTYTATLTVENDCPSQATETLIVTVDDEPCEDAVIISLIHESPVTIGESVRFTATVTGTPPITYTWDFGDGSPALVGVGLDAVTHVYTATGTVTATLNVANPCGTAAHTVVLTVDPRRVFLPIVLRQGG